MFTVTKAFSRRAINDVVFWDRTSPDLRNPYFFNKTGKMPFCLVSVVSSPEMVILKDGQIDALKAHGMREGMTEIFTDITKPTDGCVLFDEVMAGRIVGFVNEMDRMDREEFLVVHCDAGISRSGAIAAWASAYLGIPMMDEHLTHPNVQVKALLFRASNMFPNGA